MSDTQNTESELPKFFKDESGFCYVATRELRAVEGLTPYNGKIDERGFAVAEATEPTRRTKAAA